MMAIGRQAAILVGLLLLLAAIVWMVWQRPDASALAALGYPGVAIIMFFSSSTVFLPAPGFATVLTAGAVWNPLLVGLAAGIGASTGELTGYVLGRGGEQVLQLEGHGNWQRASRWLKRYGSMAVLLLAAVPNPVFDVVGVVAGSFSFPVGRFWLACVVGNSVKYAALALLADSAVGWWLAR